MEKGHWYTDKNGNHYFVKEGQTPQEGWEASKRRKMIKGGKYQVSEDGNEWKDVNKDEYDKYESDSMEFDENEEDDFGFDEEEEPNPMDEFSGPDEDGPSYAQIEKATPGILDHDDNYKYQLLGRMISDAEYYLRNRDNKHLWSGSPEQHIIDMNVLYDSLKEKPEWLTKEKIDEYEKMFKDKLSDGKKIIDENIGKFTTSELYDLINLDDDFNKYSDEEKENLRQYAKEKSKDEKVFGYDNNKNIPDNVRELKSFKDYDKKSQIDESAAYIGPKGEILAGKSGLVSHDDISDAYGKDLYTEGYIAVNPGVMGSRIARIDVPNNRNINPEEEARILDFLENLTPNKMVDFGRGPLHLSEYSPKDVLYELKRYIRNKK